MAQWSLDVLMRKLYAGNIPYVICVAILLLVFNMELDKTWAYQFGELFAGAANVTAAVKLRGIPAFKMDRIYFEGFDFLRPAGFSLALLSVLRLAPRSVLLMAPDCSSFSWMSSSGSQRYWYAPLGDTSKEWVARGNMMAARVTLLAHLAAVLGHVFIIEQPGSARFGDLPFWRHFVENICYVFKQKLFMAMHGGNSAKSTCLWSNSSHIAFLDRGPIPKSKRASLVPIAKYYDDVRGVRRSTGKPRLLRASQTYPVGFGHALADILRNMHEGVRGLRIGNDDAGICVTNLLLLMKADQDLWHHADMVSVINYLAGARSLDMPPEIRSVLGL